MFCVGTNLVIDFSKVSGSIVSHGKPPAGQQYLNFASGALSSACKRTSEYRPELFMNTTQE